MQTQCVQCALQQVHAHEHEDGRTHEDEEAEEHRDHGATLEARNEAVIEEHLGELGVSKGQSPQTKVRSSVGDGTEHELNGLNQLMDHHFAKVMGMSCVVASTLNNVIANVVFVGESFDLSFSSDRGLCLNLDDSNGTCDNSLKLIILINVLSLLNLGDLGRVCCLRGGQGANDWLNQEHGGNTDTHNGEQSKFN